MSNEDRKRHDEELMRLDVSDPEWINGQLSQMYSEITTFSEYYPVLNQGALDKIRLRYEFSNYVIDPNRFRFRKVTRIMGLVYLFIGNIKRRLYLKKRIGKPKPVVISNIKIPDQLKFSNDAYLVTTGKSSCPKGLVVQLTEENLSQALDYFCKKATKHFQDKTS